jgi:holo-[acyl-carrier protein] synthase
LLDAKQSKSSEAESLAGKWAAKEALVKAWSQMLVGRPPTFTEESFEMKNIEVVKDFWGRPSIRLNNLDLVELQNCTIRLSISHDHQYAIAQVLLVTSKPSK